MRVLRIDERSPYRRLIGIGGIGSGIFFELEGSHTLGRNESRPGRLLDVRDYCKLHIIIHYVAKLLGAHSAGSPFHVVPVGRIGSDAPGRQVLKEMTEAGIDIAKVITSSDRPTLFSVCFQYPDGSGGNITTNNSAAAALHAHDIDAAADLFRSDGKRTIALAAPEVGLEARHYFLRCATDAGAFRAASFVAAEIAAAKTAGMFSLLDLVSLNEEEASELIGEEFSLSDPESFLASCQSLLRSAHPRLKLVVSVGKHGAYGITCTEWRHSPAIEVKVASTAGAGDSLLGGIIAAVAAGLPFLPAQPAHEAPSRMVGSALELGVLLASYKCRSPHTIHPAADLDSLLMFAQSAGCVVAPQMEQFVVEKRGW